MPNVITDTIEAIRRGLLDLKNGRVISDDDIAALTIYLEARGESHQGQIAVGEVIRNRIKKAKAAKNLKLDEVFEVVFAPFQFSCWNTDAPGRAKALSLRRDDPVYASCFAAWQESATTNLTRNANHYLNPKTVIAQYGKLPTWANSQSFTTEIGAHSFYKL